MRRASLATALAASLLFGPVVAAMAADDARAVEERLLGDGQEQARFLASQPFTREIGASGIVGESLDAALAEMGVPAAAMLEARRALASLIDFDRDVAAGDRVYVRYEQGFTADGVPIGVGRVLWAEFGTKAKGTFSIHRFRPTGGIERFWSANGQAATPPSMRLPLEVLTVSSGFGLRPDPLDKPDGVAVAMGPLPEPAPRPVAPVASAPAVAAQPAPPPPHEEPAKPSPRRATRGGPLTGQFAFGPMAQRGDLDIGRFEREITEARRVTATRPVDVPAAAPEPAAPAAVVAAPPRPRQLFMHDGVDLVAPTGTPIYAASDGIVVGAGPNGGYGNWIRIEHAGKLSTVYGHLSEFAAGIEAGAPVSRGELIGFVGNTGRSTGAHLHFEILANGKAVDPLASSEIKRAQLRGADLERFRKQIKLAVAERDRETAVASTFCSP
jgi:murein DD-endopeptidase MepM/ murein hydrolase activator NlpD